MNDQLAYIIASVNKRLEDELQERLRAVGLPIEQMRILEVVASGNGLPMGELAGHALVEPTTLTKIIDRMVAEGLVSRRLDAADRRRVLIVVAPGGKVVLRRLTRITASQEARLAKRVPKAKQAELRLLLRGLVEG